MKPGFAEAGKKGFQSRNLLLIFFLQLQTGAKYGLFGEQHALYGAASESSNYRSGSATRNR
jgi:hypothetical protein